jgi:alkyl hydroperoxide reductase subunit D
MSIDALKAQMPDYAKDIKLNLSSIVNDESLSTQQLWGSILAGALGTRSAALIAVIVPEAETHLSAEAVQAAKAAASIMAMNNVYYRFIHLAQNKEYAGLPARLRMNVLANPGIEKVDFELFSLVVSAINGCGMCIDAHETELKKGGLTIDKIQTSIRIAATLAAVAAVIDGENALGDNQALAAAA